MGDPGEAQGRVAGWRAEDSRALRFGPYRPPDRGVTEVSSLVMPCPGETLRITVKTECAPGEGDRTGAVAEART